MVAACARGHVGRDRLGHLGHAQAELGQPLLGVLIRLASGRLKRPTWFSGFMPGHQLDQLPAVGTEVVQDLLGGVLRIGAVKYSHFVMVGTLLRRRSSPGRTYDAPPTATLTAMTGDRVPTQAQVPWQLGPRGRRRSTWRWSRACCSRWSPSSSGAHGPVVDGPGRRPDRPAGLAPTPPHGRLRRCGAGLGGPGAGDRLPHLGPGRVPRRDLLGGSVRHRGPRRRRGRRRRPRGRGGHGRLVRFPGADAVHLPPELRLHHRPRGDRLGTGHDGPGPRGAHRHPDGPGRAGGADRPAGGRARRPGRAGADRPRDARRGGPRAVGDRVQADGAPVRRGEQDPGVAARRWPPSAPPAARR